MREILENLIAAGCAAPSGENCQPWKFRIEDNSILLFNRPERDTSLYNHEQKGSLVSCGAVIENIVIAATAVGYKIEVELFPGDDPNFIAKLNLKKEVINEDPLTKFIFQRCTNRKPYLSDFLSDSDSHALIGSVQAFAHSGAELALMRSREDIKKIAPALTLNEQLIFSNPSLHNFFFSHLRWTEAEDAEKRDGFFVKALELKPPQVLAFKLFKHWSVIKFLGKFGFAKIAGQANLKNYESSGSIGIIKIVTNESKDYVLAGRVMQRVWLEAAARNLSLQPVTGTIFFMQKVLAGQTDEFTVNQVEMIKDSYQKISSAFDVKDATIAMLFRIGKSENPTARSSRFETKSFIEN